MAPELRSKRQQSPLRERDILLDVSRLIWRAWRGGLPTGIDRVCLAYLRHYRNRALAVAQRRGLVGVLSPADSDRLFDLLQAGWTSGRAALLRLGIGAALRGSRSPPATGMIYLNVGHTGLNEPSLPKWVADHGLRAVYMVHDLIPITHPQYCRPEEEARHRQRLDHLLISAAGVIGNSQVSLDELAAYAEGQGRGLPPAVAAWIGGWECPSSVEPMNSGRPYFVTVGTIEGRKNHLLLLKVWRKLVSRLGDAAPMLVVVGQRGWQAEHVLAVLDRPEGLETHLLELGRCSDEELARWIAGARALLMPSFAEGFGLPLIEALELGTPVIASNLPVFREIAGAIPTFLDPTDEEGWAKAVQDFTCDSRERKRQLSAVATYHAPTWPDHFKRVDAWLDELCHLGTAAP